MLSPKDLISPAKTSGYLYVDDAGGRNPFRGMSTAGGDRLSRRGSGNKIIWRGPRRAKAVEAAQDYCDYINGLGVAAPATLKSANHGGKRSPLPMDEDVQEALGILRDARAARRGKQGFVYLIGEKGYGLKYGKIGFSTNPEARMGELQTGNPRKLVLLGKVKGTEKKEAALHAKHIKMNVMQEWFVLTPEIKAEFVV